MGFIQVYTVPKKRPKTNQVVYLLEQHPYYDSLVRGIELNPRVMFDICARQRFLDNFPGRYPLFVDGNSEVSLEDELHFYTANTTEFGLSLTIERMKKIPRAFQLTFAFQNMKRISALGNYLIDDNKMRSDMGESALITRLTMDCDRPIGRIASIETVFEYEKRFGNI
jgi:hypothetical protein